MQQQYSVCYTIYSKHGIIDHAVHNMRVAKTPPLTEPILLESSATPHRKQRRDERTNERKKQNKTIEGANIQRKQQQRLPSKRSVFGKQKLSNDTEPKPFFQYCQSALAFSLVLQALTT